MCTASTQWTGADMCAYGIFCVVRGFSYHHFPFPLTSPPHYTSCLHHWLSLSASNNTCVIHIGLDIHFWQGEAWSHSQSLAAMDEVLLTWIEPVSCCDGCLSHRSIPSPLTWYDGRWYSTSARWALMLAGASSARGPWQTTLYSSNPKVLKQHLTEIEVGFVIAEEEGKKMTDGKYERERFSVLHIDCAWGWSAGRTALSLQHIHAHSSLDKHSIYILMQEQPGGGGAPSGQWAKHGNKTHIISHDCSLITQTKAEIRFQRHGDICRLQYQYSPFPLMVCGMSRVRLMNCSEPPLL